MARSVSGAHQPNEPSVEGGDPGGFLGDSVAGQTGESSTWMHSDSTRAAAAGTSERGRHAAAGTRRRRSARGGRWWWEVAAIVVVAILVSVLVRTFIASPVHVTSPAMADTLAIGDRIVVAPASTAQPDGLRAEVVVFTDPGGWLPAGDDAEQSWVRASLVWLGFAAPSDNPVMVLRVIATEGQRISCCSADGVLELDGRPLQEPYLRPGMPTDQVPFDVVVPPGHVFVLGDDREVARDSRYHLSVNQGAVPLSAIEGRASFVAWPPSRWGSVTVPSETTP